MSAQFPEDHTNEPKTALLRMAYHILASMQRTEKQMRAQKNSAQLSSKLVRDVGTECSMLRGILGTSEKNLTLSLEEAREYLQKAEILKSQMDAELEVINTKKAQVLQQIEDKLQSIENRLQEFTTQIGVEAEARAEADAAWQKERNAYFEKFERDKTANPKKHESRVLETWQKMLHYKAVYDSLHTNNAVTQPQTDIGSNSSRPRPIVQS